MSQHRVEQQILTARRDHSSYMHDGQHAGLVQVRDKGFPALHRDGQPGRPQRRATGDPGQPCRGLDRDRPAADHRTQLDAIGPGVEDPSHRTRRPKRSAGRLRHRLELQCRPVGVVRQSRR
jgi:hypothetical protein